MKYKHEVIRSLEKTTRRKLSVALALLGEPDIILLVNILLLKKYDIFIQFIYLHLTVQLFHEDTANRFKSSLQLPCI